MYEWRGTNNTTLMNINHTIFWILISSFECFHSIVGKLHWTRHENCPNTEFFLVPKKKPHKFLGIYFLAFISIYFRLAFESYWSKNPPLCCNYSPSFNDFSILTREINDFKLKIMESLLIARDKPIINKADSSLPLELF